MNQRTSRFLGPTSITQVPQGRSSNPMATGKAQLKMPQSTQSCTLKWTYSIREALVKQGNREGFFPCPSMDVFNITAGDIIFTIGNSDEAYTSFNGLPKFGSSEELLSKIIVRGIAATDLNHLDADRKNPEAVAVYVSGATSVYSHGIIEAGYNVRVTLAEYDSSSMSLNSKTSPSLLNPSERNLPPPPDQTWYNAHKDGFGAIKPRLAPVTVSVPRRLGYRHVLHRSFDKNRARSSYKEQLTNDLNGSFTLKPDDRVSLAVDGALFKGFFSMLAPLAHSGAVELKTFSDRLYEVCKTIIFLHHTNYSIGSMKTAEISKAKHTLDTISLKDTVKEQLESFLRVLEDGKTLSDDSLEVVEKIIKAIASPQKGSVISYFTHAPGSMITEKSGLISRTSTERSKKFTETTKEKMETLAKQVGFIEGGTMNYQNSRVYTDALSLFLVDAPSSSLSPVAYGRSGSGKASLQGIMERGPSDWMLNLLRGLNSYKSCIVGRVEEVLSNSVLYISINTSGAEK